MFSKKWENWYFSLFPLNEVPVKCHANTPDSSARIYCYFEAMTKIISNTLWSLVFDCLNNINWWYITWNTTDVWYALKPISNRNWCRYIGTIGSLFIYWNVQKLKYITGCRTLYFDAHFVKIISIIEVRDNLWDMLMCNALLQKRTKQFW